MRAAVLIAKKCHQLRVRVERNIFRIFDGVQVGNERDRDPVVTRDSRVAADDYAVLPGIAAAQGDGSRGADTRQVNRGVAGSGKGSIVAIGLFEKDSNICVRLWREPGH